MDVVLPSSSVIGLTELAGLYFHVKPKLKCRDICALINEFHGLPVTMRKLKEIFRKKGFSRRRNIDNATLSEVLLNELGKTIWIH